MQTRLGRKKQSGYEIKITSTSQLQKMNTRGEMKMFVYIFISYFLRNCICFRKLHINYLVRPYLKRYQALYACLKSSKSYLSVGFALCFKT